MNAPICFFIHKYCTYAVSISRNRDGRGGLYIFVVEKWLPTHFRSKIPTTLSSTPFNISELASLFKNDCKIEISFDKDM